MCYALDNYVLFRVTERTPYKFPFGCRSLDLKYESWKGPIGISSYHDKCPTLLQWTQLMKLSYHEWMVRVKVTYSSNRYFAIEGQERISPV